MRHMCLKISIKRHGIHDRQNSSLKLSIFQALNYLYFIVNELDPEGTGYNKLLYINIQCKYVLIGKVLIDNDSILNMLPTHML